MRGVCDKQLKEEAEQLRRVKRLSLNEISRELGVSKGTLSAWLRDVTLTQDELAVKARRTSRAHKDRGIESCFHQMARGYSLTGADKGRIAEAAVLFRLALHGLAVFRPVFDGDQVDLLVRSPSGAHAKVQIKYAAKWGKSGSPQFGLTCSLGHNGRQRYALGSFDFIIGYDLFTDIAYVFSWQEVSGYTRSITIRDDAAERWDKLLAFGATVHSEVKSNGS